MNKQSTHTTVVSNLDTYLQNRPLFLSLIRAKEAELFTRFMPYKEPILDVGCGDGFFAQTVFNTVSIGLDVPQSRINEAYKSDVYKKLVQYDGVKFPFPNNSFQTVISNCVLEHINDVDRIIKEMYRVLAPGGFCIVTVMAKPWEEHLFGSIFLGNTYRQYMKKKQVHIHLLTSSEWKQTFVRSGFQIKKCIGYLSPHACRLIDISHYLSLPNLCSYIFFHTWVLFPWLRFIFPMQHLAHLIEKDVPIASAGALFFVLTKNKKSRVQ